MGTLKFEQVFITRHLTISRKETLISFSKALNIFLFSMVYKLINHAGFW